MDMKRRILFGTYGILLIAIYYCRGVCLYGYRWKISSQIIMKGMKGNMLFQELANITRDKTPTKTPMMILIW